MQQSWLLKCGSDVVGTVTSVKAGTPTNFGQFEAGPDYEKHRASFEAMWSTGRALDIHRSRVDDNTVDDERDAVEAVHMKVLEEFDQFEFAFEDIDANERVDIHWFRPDGEDGEVHWQFGKLPALYVYSHVNVYNTCLNILRLRGFKLWVVEDEDEEGCFRCRDIWNAQNDDVAFTAHAPVELLGLAAIYDYVTPRPKTESCWWHVDGPDLWGELLFEGREDEADE